MSCNRLVYKSKSLSLIIANYCPLSFIYNGWEVMDEYIYCEKYESFSSYQIIVSSKEILNEQDLSNTLRTGWDVINMITELLPFCTFLSLNNPQGLDGSRTRGIILYNKAPEAWEFNYSDVKSQLDASKATTGIKISAECSGVNHYARIEDSPLKELELMMQNYQSLPDHIKYLIFLYNEIIKSETSSRYMLIGKALEIVNALYPYKRVRNKKDFRIQTYFPELQSCFGELSISELIALSNTRRETRHYIAGVGMESHQSMTEKERKDLYTCTILLLLNIVRVEFGLDQIIIN